MALYEYGCRKCGRAIEAFRSLDARNDPSPCPCGGLAWRRPSVTGIRWGCPRPGYPTPDEILRGEDPYAGNRRKAEPRRYAPDEEARVMEGKTWR